MLYVYYMRLRSRYYNKGVSLSMHTRLLSLLSQRLLIAVLTVGLCLTGVSLALFQHVRSASAASAPYYSMVIDGQKYVAQYEGGAYNSDVTSHSLYSDFGRWNEYTVDRDGTWHWYGQFSGNEDTYVNGNGKIQTGINVNIPGVGHIFTYPHEDVLRPKLAPPGGFRDGYESYMGTQVDTAYEQADCEVDASNLDNGYLGSGIFQFRGVSGIQAPPGQNDCFNASDDLHRGDVNIYRLYHQLSQSLAATPNTNGPVVASLQRPQVLPVPVILGIASGVFFIAATVTGNICAFASCSKTTKKVLAGVALGLGIISGVLGIASGIQTAMRAFATAAPAAIPAVTAGAVGDAEAFAAVANRVGNQVLSENALSEASDISSDAFDNIAFHP